MFPCSSCCCSTELGYLIKSPRFSSESKKIYCQMCFITFFPGETPEIVKNTINARRLLGTSSQSSVTRSSLVSSSSSSLSSSSSSALGEDVIFSSDVSLKIKPCSFCSSVNYTIIATCDCETVISCIGCSNGERICSKCKGFIKYNPFKQFQFHHTTNITCPACRCLVLSSHLEFHIKNACTKNDSFKQKLVKTLSESSKVVKSLDDSHYTVYKKNLQAIYDDLSANPETADMYRIVDHEKKRTRREEEVGLQIDLTGTNSGTKKQHHSNVFI